MRYAEGSLRGGQHVLTIRSWEIAERERGPLCGRPHFRTLTARARTSAVVKRAMALCRAINDVAHRDSGVVSVGEKA